MGYYVIVLILAGVAAGFFLSTFLVVLLAGVCVIALVSLWPMRTMHSGGGDIGGALICFAILLFLFSMAITATVVRLVAIGNGDNVNWYHVGVWLNHHIFRQ